MSKPPIRVIQFGGGNFLRAFADWLIEVLNQQTDFNGGVAVVKARPGHYETLASQQGRYHVLTEGIVNGERMRELEPITCVQRVVASDDFDAFLALAEIPTARFVISNTTEAGITFDANDRIDDAPPSSFPAKLTQLLLRRWLWAQETNSAETGFVMLPTELIDHNGDQLRDCVLSYAKLWDTPAAFREWVQTHNTFCNTLVDRIVTGYPANADTIAPNDKLLVAAEPYHLWAIEAPIWLSAELPLDQTSCNVRFVDDLQETRTLKVRILNGAHTSMVPLGLLHGFESVREAVNNPDFGAFLTALLTEEIAPTLPYPTADAYVATTLDRFRNPAIHHKLSAIALNSVSKFRVRVLPSLLAYLDKDEAVPPRLVRAFAGLIRFYQGEWQGEPLPINDDPAVVAFFADAWATSAETYDLVTRVLQNDALWGTDLSHHPRLTADLAAALHDLEEPISNASPTYPSGGDRLRRH